MEDLFFSHVASKRQNFYSQLTKQDESANVYKKCSIISTSLREKGNELYRSKNHDSKIHEKILSLYSESIAYAPEGSEELALGYSNRSALLLHLNRPKNSLIDIAKALEITKSTYLRTKLFSRKANCLEHIEKSTGPKDYYTSDALEIPAFTPSKEVPCAADCVKVVYNEQFGTHIVATRDIEPGEVISAETGYAVFPNANQLYLNCSHCLRLAWNGIPCDSCVFAIFCSEVCKKEAWNAYHDIECHIIPYVFIKTFDKSNCSHIMTTARMFITAAKKEGLKNMLHIAESMDKSKTGTNVWSTEEFVYESFRCCYNLVSHEKLMNWMRASIYKEQANLILNLLYKHTDILSTFQKTDADAENVHDNVQIFLAFKKILFRLRNICLINNYYYQTLEQDDSNFQLPNGVQGLIIAPFSACFNHSCYPINVIRIFMPKRKIVMMTVLPVKKGEQLYANYGPSITLEKHKRQAYLRDCYHFTCECQGCQNDWTEENLFKLAPDYKLNSDFKFLQKFYKINSPHLNGEPADWPMDRKSVKEAIEVCKLLRKNLKDHDALRYSFRYSVFLEMAFIFSYQEKRYIPNHC